MARHRKEVGEGGFELTCELVSPGVVEWKLFVTQLDDQELAILERALSKVIIDCSFG